MRTGRDHLRDPDEKSDPVELLYSGAWSQRVANWLNFGLVVHLIDRQADDHEPAVLGMSCASGASDAADDEG